ncbi:MAG: PSD1 and planctomycete cytochrome C domain-containing protein [Planctomycetaceae bacterium]
MAGHTTDRLCRRGLSRLIVGIACLQLHCGRPTVAEDVLEFSRDIRPLLAQACFRCHGPDQKQRKGELSLHQRQGITAVFRGGSLQNSAAWQRMTSDDPEQVMPPPESNLTLSPADIKRIQRWIEQGARWQGHWAFVPPTRPLVPAEGGSNPIDSFILTGLKSQSIQPVVAADHKTLLRRMTLDLTGLPPTPEAVDAYIANPSPRAYEEFVDQRLAALQFGERMAVYWLDLVRYADSVGYHKDSHRECWLYRDYVIDAFNFNKPYDAFVREQSAGDLLPGPKLNQLEWKVASGFNRMNQTTSEGGAQAKEYLAKYSADRVRNTAAIFLGSTLGCAECHDHKYDPFTTADFYRFAAFFADLQERGVGFPKQTPLPTRIQREQWQRLEREISELKKRLSNTKDDQAAAIRAEIETRNKQLQKVSDPKSWPKTLITESGKPRTMRILPRGNWLDESGPEVTPAIPAFLGRLETQGRRPSRLDLAEWIVADKNPLTARVFVNRLWKLFMGEGLSRTLDDLGLQGSPPTHPRLLDWLAVEFIDSGWDVKHMVKLIVMSQAYRRSSVCSTELRRRDPENRWFARQVSLRLPAEFVRDNALAISGLLSTKIGGPSVKPYQPANYWYRLYKDAKYNQNHGSDLYRRGVYTYWRRSFWHPSLRAFDAPAREECVAQRPRSNTPSQSLVLLNDPTYVEAARVLATQMLQHGGSDAKQRIRWAFRRAVTREPLPEESAVLAGLYTRQLKRYRTDVGAATALIRIGETTPPPDVPVSELAAWTSVARTILNLHETITRN